MLQDSRVLERKQKNLPSGVSIACNFLADRAKNAEIWTTEGQRYIDFAGGIGVLNTGHLHPKIVAAVEQQLKKFSHTCFQVVPYELYFTVAEKINALAPIAGDSKCMFVSTGAEAVENAIKIARAYNKRRGVISFQGAFHGRTNLTLALTGKVVPYKLNFGPFPGDVYHAQYPNSLYGVSVTDALNNLKQIFKVDIAAEEVAAIIIEPIQGEGGFNVTPFEFLQQLRQICDEHNIVLIFDEVQSGFARTGKYFATEHTGVKPDLITMAKSLAGGFPLSGVVGKASIMDVAGYGGLGGTYAGNPLALAAANAVIDVIKDEKLCERAVVLGDKIKHLAAQLQASVAQIQECRGLGSMVAIEFMQPETKQPNGEIVKKIIKQALDNKLILLSCGTNYNVIRFLYPLTIEDEVFDEALAILQAAIVAAK